MPTQVKRIVHKDAIRMVKGASEDTVDKLNELIEQYAKDGAPVDTGTLRDSIHQVEDGVVASAPYAGAVEYGTQFQPAQPYMRPAFVKAKAKVAEIMKSEMKER